MVTEEEFRKFMMIDWKYTSGQVMDCNGSPDLFKLPVIGHVIIKFYDSIQSYPITSSDDYTDADLGGYNLNQDEMFITVIPPTIKMFKVCAYLPEGTPEEIMNNNFTGFKFKVLGWEYEGMPILDWDKIYRETSFEHVWIMRNK